MLLRPRAERMYVRTPVACTERGNTLGTAAGFLGLLEACG